MLSNELEDTSVSFSHNLLRATKPPNSVLMNVYRFAAYLYTPEGKVVRERCWEETLAELEFAGVKSILESMRV